MFLRVLYRFTLLGLCIGFVALFTGCGNGTAVANEASVIKHPTPSQVTMTPASIPTALTETPTPASPSKVAFPTGPVRVPTPLPTAVSLPPTPTSPPGNPNALLTLALACSGTNAQDGFSVTNSAAHACVYTSPGASLTIAVDFCNAPDSSSAIRGTFTANARGFYQWTWAPQAPSGCQPSSAWSVTVNASLSGQSASVSDASATS